MARWLSMMPLSSRVTELLSVTTKRSHSTGSETMPCVGWFFFQAEDGIRDWSVTGVQACALPISSRRRHTNWSVTGVQTCALPIYKTLTLYAEKNIHVEQYPGARDLRAPSSLGAQNSAVVTRER